MADTGKAAGPNWSTALIFLSFGLVFLIIFVPSIQVAMGNAAGYVLAPTIGFGGHYPVLTLFLASVILVVVTTAIRHFLTDWKAFARSQEAIRAYQKEFMEARKANNTYKMKKLADAQPQVFEMQAAMQKESFKPMAVTMLLVIPIFAWLGTTLSQPVPMELAAAPADPVAVVAMNGLHVHDAYVADPSRVGTDAMSVNIDTYNYALRPPGSSAETSGEVVLRNPKTGHTFAADASRTPVVPEGAKVADLAAGSYTFSVVPPTGPNSTLQMTGEHGPYNVDSVMLVFMQGSRLVRAHAVGPAVESLAFDAPVAMYAVIPDGLGGGTNEGTAKLNVGGATPTVYDLTSANVVEVEPAIGAPVYPYNAGIPWSPNHWSLKGLWWVIPHWILLYSLFGIPFGQVAQRALKLWEYRHLDMHGRPKSGPEV